jgi:hypothetical protein
MEFRSPAPQKGLGKGPRGHKTVMIGDWTFAWWAALPQVEIPLRRSQPMGKLTWNLQVLALGRPAGPPSTSLS